MIDFIDEHVSSSKRKELRACAKRSVSECIADKRGCALPFISHSLRRDRRKGDLQGGNTGERERGSMFSLLECLVDREKQQEGLFIKRPFNDNRREREREKEYASLKERRFQLASLLLPLPD